MVSIYAVLVVLGLAALFCMWAAIDCFATDGANLDRLFAWLKRARKGTWFSKKERTARKYAKATVDRLEKELGIDPLPYPEPEPKAAPEPKLASRPMPDLDTFPLVSARTKPKVDKRGHMYWGVYIYSPRDREEKNRNKQEYAHNGRTQWFVTQSDTVWDRLAKLDALEFEYHEGNTDPRVGYAKSLEDFVKAAVAHVLTLVEHLNTDAEEFDF